MERKAHLLDQLFTPNHQNDFEILELTCRLWTQCSNLEAFEVVLERKYSSTGSTHMSCKSNIISRIYLKELSSFKANNIEDLYIHLILENSHQPWSTALDEITELYNEEVTSGLPRAFSDETGRLDGLENIGDKRSSAPFQSFYSINVVSKRFHCFPLSVAEIHWFLSNSWDYLPACWHPLQMKTSTKTIS